jgi:arginine/lysine/ornithine decarboxylase
MMQSTSPSYPLLASIETSISDLEGSQGRHLMLRLSDLACNLRASVTRLSGYSVYDTASGIDPLHILISHQQHPAPELFEFLIGQSIFPEAVLGTGVLFMLGVGTNQTDIDLLLDALRRFGQSSAMERAVDHLPNLDSAGEPTSIEQVMTPRAAVFAPSHLVARDQAENLIAAECIAPCPPGIPLSVPGQRLTKEVLKQIEKEQIRIVS